MQPNEPEARLTGIDTHWSELFEADKATGEAATAAQREELLRYYGAVRRYLAGIVHDPALAEELAQEFAVRFLRGDFKRADPERGRFRDLLKTALRCLVRDHWRKKQFASLTPACSAQLARPLPREHELDRMFLDHWWEELLDRT
jgi:RNA polymerase sigma-70 factor (ECF subfamily)